MKTKPTALAFGLLLMAGAISAQAVAAAGDFHLESTIAFTSTRDHVNDGLMPPTLGGEIYLANPDMTNPRRLTYNTDEDDFASLSPDGKKIVFDSNRDRPAAGSTSDPCSAANTPPFSCYTSDLFLMKTDGSEQSLLTRGGSATWSPDSKQIAFHASASGSGTPLRNQPGSATTDSDIFVARVDETGVENRTNITRSWTVNSDGTRIRTADDPDWSPDGESIVFTAHNVGDEGPNYPKTPFNSSSAEIYEINADGTGTPTQVTKENGYEERGPSWSPDGTRIAFACRIGSAGNDPITDFEICVLNKNPDGTWPDHPHPVQLTDNDVMDLTPTFSPDGQKILFHRTVGAQGSANQQLFVMNAALKANGDVPDATRLTDGTPTSPDGINHLANWGELRVNG
jgi:Tol biopolymer transport system component